MYETTIIITNQELLQQKRKAAYDISCQLNLLTQRIKEVNKVQRVIVMLLLVQRYAEGEERASLGELHHN
jgi:hypothetical protein